MFELVNTEYSTAACPIWSVATWLRATILKYGAQHCLIVHNQSHPLFMIKSGYQASAVAMRHHLKTLRWLMMAMNLIADPNLIILENSDLHHETNNLFLIISQATPKRVCN